MDDSCSFCPYCGTDMQNTKTEMDQSLRCPYCHEIIHKEDVKCPHCQKKLKFSDRMNKDEKAGLYELLLAGLGMAFCLVPFVSLLFLALSCIFSCRDKSQGRYKKDAFFFSILGLVMSTGILILNLYLVFQNAKQNVSLLTGLFGLFF